MTAMTAISQFPSRLLGPVMLKELLVSSRRRRLYTLRAIYLLCLVGFLALVWLSVMGTDFSLRSRAQMADAGRLILGSMNWFQFAAMQILAVLLCCGGIGEEARKRTLPALLTTPVTNLQIIVGKLASCMLQLLVLLAINLPFLAMVRVLGGVPITSVLGSLCITMCMALAVAAMTLRLSVTRSPLGSIMGMLALIAVFLGMTAVVKFGPTTLLHLLSDGNSRYPVFGWTSSVMTLVAIQCGAMLFIAGWAVTSASRALSRRLRDDSIIWSPGGKKVLPKPGLAIVPPPVPRIKPPPLPSEIARAAEQDDEDQDAQDPQDAAITRVVGWPLVWKELLFFAPQRRKHTVLAIMALVAVLSLIYCAMGTGLRDFHHIYLWIYLLAALAITVSTATACIASEKQSRTLAILLTTPMSDWQIVIGKMTGIFKKCMVPWMLAVLHVVCLGVPGVMPRGQALEFLVMLAWLSMFVVALGLYLSARFQAPTWALITMVGVLCGLWILAPSLLGIASHRSMVIEQWRVWSLDANPFHQAWAILWMPIYANDDRPPVLKPLLASAALYSCLAALLLLRAKACIRKDLF